MGRRGSGGGGASCVRSRRRRFGGLVDRGIAGTEWHVHLEAPASASGAGVDQLTATTLGGAPVATDDAYQVVPGESLILDAAGGLLATDVDTSSGERVA